MKKLFVVLTSILLITSYCQSQSDHQDYAELTADSYRPHKVKASAADLKASTMKNLQSELITNLEYPEIMEDNFQEGKCHLVINMESGMIKSYEIRNSLGKHFDREIIKSIDKVKQLNYLTLNHSSLSFRMIVPIVFRMQ